MEHLLVFLRDSLQFGYRHAKVDPDFVPGGETVDDGSVKLSYSPRRDLSVKAFIGYEKWRAPILAVKAQQTGPVRLRSRSGHPPGANE